MFELDVQRYSRMWLQAAPLLLGIAGLPSLLSCRTEATPRTLAAEPARSAAIVLGRTRLFNTLSRETVTLSSLAGTNGTVLFFTGNSCPVARAYEHDLAGLSGRLGPLGLRLIVVNSNYDEGPAEIRQHRAEAQLTFPIFKDRDGSLATRLGVTRTSETVLLSPAGKVTYRGRIDDKNSVGGVRRARPTSTDLLEAVADMTAGRAVRRPYTEASGCFLALRRGESAVGAVTYADVAPIFERYCVACHQVDQIGPMPLTTYDQVAPWSDTVAEVMAQRRMPPWNLGGADPRFGHFQTYPMPTDAEIKMIGRWAAANAPQGPLVARSEPATPTDDWLLGKPDLIIEMPTSIEVPAKGTVPYKYPWIYTEREQDRWIESIEFKPGARAVVHHVVALIGTAPPDPKRSIDKMPDDAVYTARFLPGLIPGRLPEGFAYRLPRGASIYLQNHYTPDGIARQDRTRIGIRFRRSPPPHETVMFIVSAEQFKIPPRERNVVVTGEETLKAAAYFVSVGPHMHLRGKSSRLEVIYPDGTSEIMLDVPRYSFEWQRSFFLQQIRLMPKGTKLRVTSVFDNSAENPYNPNPDVPVCYGEQSWDEMAEMWIELSYVGPRQPPQVWPPPLECPSPRPE